MEGDSESAWSELRNGDEESKMVDYGEDYEGENWEVMWETKHREAAIHVVSYGAYLVSLLHIHHQSKGLQAVKMGKRKDMEAPATVSLRWSVPMDRVFIEALMNEVACGNRVDGQFTSLAYENIIRECTQKLHHPFTKDHLKNRLKTLKSNFHEVFDLFGSSGWGWNEETEMFEYEDEFWESLLEKKPQAKKWRNTPFHHFDLLTKLFSNGRASADDSCTAKEKKLLIISTTAGSSDKDESIVEAKTGDSKELVDSHIGKRKRKSIEDFLREEISTIKNGLDNVAQALRERNKVIEQGRPRVYAAEEVFEELTRMELNTIVHRKAYRFLNVKQGRVRELFGLPPEERKGYLMEMMIEEGV